MSTEIYLPDESSLSVPSLARHLHRWLGAWRSAKKAEANSFERTSLTHALDKGRTLWVGRPLTREVSCSQGTLWLTFDGVRKDIVLEAGQSYRCECASRLGIHAVEAARFEMS